MFSDRADLDQQLRLRILGDLRDRLGPALDLHGTIAESIEFAVDTYVQWIVEFPRLHQFLSIGSRAKRTVGARAVTETKAEIAQRVSAIAVVAFRANGADPRVADSLAFGLIGLVDATVNRWLASPERIDAEGLSVFLRTSIWNVIHGTAAEAGVELDPTMQVAALMGASEPS